MKYITREITTTFFYHGELIKHTQVRANDITTESIWRKGMLIYYRQNHTVRSSELGLKIKKEIDL